MKKKKEYKKINDFDFKTHPEKEKVKVTQLVARIDRKDLTISGSNDS